MVEIERGTCTFCEMDSEYVLSIEDPCPYDDEQLFADSEPLPVCHHHWKHIKSEVSE